MKYEFEVPGKVIGKERPRINMYTGRVYTPNKTKEYENLIQQYFKIKYPTSEVLENRICIDIIAYFKIPKGTSKIKVEEMKKGSVSPTQKPDIDNIAKSVLDAMNKIAFKDDNQVTKISIEKCFGTEEKIEIKIEEY